MHRQFHKCSASLVRHPCFFCIGLLPLENKDVTTLAGVVAITGGTASVFSKSADGLFKQPPAPQFVALTGGKISIRKGEDAVPSPFRIQIWLMRRRKTICIVIGCWQCELEIAGVWQSSGKTSKRSVFWCIPQFAVLYCSVNDIVEYIKLDYTLLHRQQTTATFLFQRFAILKR